MIKYSDCIKWLGNDDSDLSFKMVTVIYNPSLKDKIIKRGKWDRENLPSDINKFSEILSDVFLKYVGENFNVRLFNQKFSWLPDFIKDEDEKSILIEEYLNSINWHGDKFFGDFEITNLKEFYSLFFDYPVRYRYQEILIQPSDKSLIIDISHHGEIWIVSNDEALLSSIRMDFDLKGATVL